MIAPVEQLIDSIEAMLTLGVASYGLPALFPAGEDIPVYRADSMDTMPVPHCVIYQAGPAKERHKADDSIIWEIPMGVKLIMDRNGLAIGDSPEDAAADIREYASEMEAVLTMPLLIDSENPGAGRSTPEQRLTTAALHVFSKDGVYDVEVMADTEAEGDPSCEVNFTVVCTQAANVIY